MSWTGKILRALDILPKVPRANGSYPCKPQELEPSPFPEEDQALTALRKADEKNEDAGRKLFKTALDGADHTGVVKNQVDQVVERIEHTNRSDKVLATAEAALDLIARGRLR
jgi:hypothetical protein